MNYNTSDHTVNCIESIAPMDIYEQLLVRACKSERYSTLFRYRKILARKVSIHEKFVRDCDVAEWMLSVVLKYNLIRLKEFILHLDPRSDYWHTTLKVPSYDNHDERLIGRCSSAIVTTSISKLPGYRRPLRFKNINLRY